MERGRRNIHICLTCMLLAALAAGVFYFYLNSTGEYRDMEGTLVRSAWEEHYVS